MSYRVCLVYIKALALIPTTVSIHPTYMRSKGTANGPGLFIFKDLTWRLIKAVQWVKVLVPKPDNLNLIFSIHIAERTDA